METKMLSAALPREAVITFFLVLAVIRFSFLLKKISCPKAARQVYGESLFATILSLELYREVFLLSIYRSKCAVANFPLRYRARLRPNLAVRSKFFLSYSSPFDTR